jgi:SAM-dependent methyltransferase
MDEVYDDPKYYELAFSFRDIPAEVDVFEAFITQYSRIPVSQVLELGCGPAPHLVELVRRGYRYVGLDLSRPMLASAQQRADLLQIPAKFHLASMIDLILGEPTLVKIARELVETVKKNVTIDWTVRENVRAQLRVIVKRILRKYGYPPDKQEKATQTVLEQAEVLSEMWAIA